MKMLSKLSRKKKREIALHIVCWLLFGSILVFLFGFLPGDSEATLPIVMYIPPLIALFYTNTSLLIPRLLAKKKVILYILTVIGAVTFIIYTYHGIQILLNNEFYYKHGWFPRIVTQQAFMNSLLVLTVSGGLKMTREWFRNERLKNEMENEKMASELALLKSQINPHSLFNNLNSIYSLAIKKSEDAPKAIVKLSEMMRYMLYDSAASQISLSKEVEHLQNYIDLQKLRVSRKTRIQFEIDGDIETKMIEPMLLEPFVENAFKHGDIFREQSQIIIQLKVVGDELYFYVENTVTQNGHVKDKHSGIGLKNIEKRLSLLYPGQHRLEVRQDEDKFIVSLKLNLVHDKMPSYR